MGLTAARPSTSLIVSSRDRPAFLERIVDSVLAGGSRPDEMIVIDQSATPSGSMVAVAAETPAWFRYQWTHERGLSRGRNAGISLARGEWLVFVDDDVLLPPDWFERMVAAVCRAGPRAAVTGRVVEGDPETPGAFAPSLSLSEVPVVHRGRPGRDVLQPLNMAVHRDVFVEVGDFDVRLGAGAHFPSSEDNDFGYRLLEAGYQIVYDPSVVVIHRAWRTPGALVPLRWSYGRGQGAYFAKHASLRDRYMLRRLWVDLARHVRRAPRRARARPLDGVADLVYGAALIEGAAEWIITRPRP